MGLIRFGRRHRQQITAQLSYVLRANKRMSSLTQIRASRAVLCTACQQRMSSLTQIRATRAVFANRSTACFTKHVWYLHHRALVLAHLCPESRKGKKGNIATVSLYREEAVLLTCQREVSIPCCAVRACCSVCFKPSVCVLCEDVHRSAKILKCEHADVPKRLSVNTLKCQSATRA